MVERVGRADLVQRLADMLGGLGDAGPVLVGVDGVDGAGKTTLASELTLAISGRGRTCHHVELDDFQHARPYRTRRGVHSPLGCYYDTFDYRAVATLLLDPLRRGGDCRCRLRFFDQPNQRPYPEEWVTVPSDAIVIIDAGYLHRPELAGRWDLTLFVTVPFEVAIQRGIQRDLGFQLQREPRSDEEARVVEERIRKRWQLAWIPAQQLYQEVVDPKSKADVLIDNTDLAAPAVEWQVRP